MLDPADADTAEELAEIAVSVMEMELEGQRCSVLHGDEQQNRPVIQSFAGFSVAELDLLDWLQWSWEEPLRTPGVFLQLQPEEFRGSSAWLVGLHDVAGRFLGLLHVDWKNQAPPLELVDEFALFAADYGRRLSQLLPAPPPSAVALGAPVPIKVHPPAAPVTEVAIPAIPALPRDGVAAFMELQQRGLPLSPFARVGEDEPQEAAFSPASPARSAPIRSTAAGPLPDLRLPSELAWMDDY